MSFHFGSSLSLGLVFVLSPFLFLFLLFLHADALAFIFFGPSFGLPEFFFFFGLRALALVQNVLALRVGLAALSCSLAGFEAMFWVEWVGADATGRNNSRGGFCLRAPPSNHGHLLCTVEGYRPLYLPVVNLAPRWEGGMVGVRNERQTHLPTPPVWTAPLRSSLSSPSRGIIARVL